RLARAVDDTKRWDVEASTDVSDDARVVYGTGACGGGLDPDTPAPIVERASGPGERVLEARLGAMAEDFAASGFASPALILVGEALRAPAALGARAEAFTRPSPGPRSFAAG